jgi:hypothetical protein
LFGGPRVSEREILEEGQLDPAKGLVGDSWSTRSAGRPPHFDVQLTLMNVRVTALVAQDKSRWPLAGAQLYVDLDLSDDNLPAGTQLAIGSAVIQVSAQTHTGCASFVDRFGMDAMLFVKATDGRAMHLRGINASVVQPGVIRVGDRVGKPNGGA